MTATLRPDQPTPAELGLPIEPIIFRIVVKPKKYQVKSKGGIITVSTHKEFLNEQALQDTGKVLWQAPAAGRFFEKTYNTPWPIKNGDYIQWQRGTGFFYENPQVSGEYYVLLGDEDVISKLVNVNEADYE
jgi:co-chaperonin GroES (HSP10)